jgi:hypothetical protein
MSRFAVTVAVAANDDAVLHQNLLRSPELASGETHQLLVRRGYPSAARAYNSALDEADHDIVVFVHQDVYLPAGWFAGLEQAVAAIEAGGVRWGVLGCFGSRPDAFGGVGEVYTRGLGRHGRALLRPEVIETLDEILLVVRRSSGLRFDPALPHYHLYGTDICLEARTRGLATLAFQGFLVHNTNQLLALPPEFYACYRYVRRKWRTSLPIATACLTISRFNGALIRKRLAEARHWLRSRQGVGLSRVPDPRVFCRGD